MDSNKPRLCFIGFGEAGQAIANELRPSCRHRRNRPPIAAGPGAF